MLEFDSWRQHLTSLSLRFVSLHLFTYFFRQFPCFPVVCTIFFLFTLDVSFQKTNPLVDYVFFSYFSLLNFFFFGRGGLGSACRYLGMTRNFFCFCSLLNAFLILVSPPFVFSLIHFPTVYSFFVFVFKYFVY